MLFLPPLLFDGAPYTAFGVAFPLAVREHPVKVAQGEWTSVIGVMESTFTRHMTVPDGTVVQPTGKVFKIKMATIGRWNAAGVMTRKYLFWDNQTFMTQLGLAK